MEIKPDIENQIKKAFDSVKNTEPVELPYGFSERVMNKLPAKENNVKNLYTLYPVLKVAALLLLILINVFTLRLALNSAQPTQNPVQYLTINDFVNGYQINDTNDELISLNTPTHEQP